MTRRHARDGVDASAAAGSAQQSKVTACEHSISIGVIQPIERCAGSWRIMDPIDAQSWSQLFA